MNVAYLTYNPNLGSTSRPLQGWIELGRGAGLNPCVGLREPGPLSRWLETRNVPHLIHPMSWPDKGRMLGSLAGTWGMSRWCRTLGVDLLHCNEHDSYPFGVLLARLLRRPIVCLVQFQVSRSFCEWAFCGWRRPDALVWTSEQQRIDCADAIEGLVPADRQFTVPLGVDPERFGTLETDREATRRSWGVGSDAVVVGAASALRPRKRIEDFVELIRRISAEVPEVVGVLAGDARPGDEDYRERILRQVEEAGLRDRFRWLGKLDPIEPFYHAIDVFVSTSEYETFGMSVCEAMACRRPVAGYRGGSVHEVVGDSGLVVETGDLPALFDAVKALASRPELRAEMGERGRERVATRFSPAASLRRWTDIYRTLLACD